MSFSQDFCFQSFHSSQYDCNNLCLVSWRSGCSHIFGYDFVVRWRKYLQEELKAVVDHHQLHQLHQLIDQC